MIEYAPIEINDRGNFVYHDDYADELIGDHGACRSYYDQGACSPQKGWQQFATKQDTHHFGCWVNKYLREIFCYAEGDRTIVVCPTEKLYHQELEHMATHFSAPPVDLTIQHVDETTTKHYRHPHMKQSVKITVGQYLDEELPTPVTAFIDQLQDLVSNTPYPYLQDVLIDRATDYRGGEYGYTLYYYRPETPEEEQEREISQAEVELRMKELERAQFERLKAKVERGEI